VMVKHLTEDAPPITEFQPECNLALVEIVERLMQKDADDRYQSPTALIAAVKALDEQPAPREPSAPARRRRRR